MADAPLTPDDLVLVSRAALVRLQAHARIPGNNICEFSKAKPEGMCGWLDDACTHADIVAADLQKLIDSAPQPQPPAAPLTESALTQAADAGAAEPVAWRLQRKNHLTGEWVSDENERWANGAPPPDLVENVAQYPDLYRLCFAYAAPPAQQLQQAVARALAPIQQAIRDYHYALDTRQHGGVAQGKAVGAIEEALGMHWQRGVELAARATKEPPCSA